MSNGLTKNNEVIFEGQVLRSALSSGNFFRNKIVDYIKSWGQDLDVITEYNYGQTEDRSRCLDILIRRQTGDFNRYATIECKWQSTPGTNEQKFRYSVEDMNTLSIPHIMLIAGNGANSGICARLRGEGKAIVLQTDIPKKKKQCKNNSSDEVPAEQIYLNITDKNLVFRKWVYAQLGMDLFELCSKNKVA